MTNNKFSDETIKDFARFMASTDDRQQAIFFNTFGETLKMVCKNNNSEMQSAYMSAYFNHSGCEVLEVLGGFAKLKREEVTPSMIDVKRKIMLTRRKLNE